MIVPQLTSGNDNQATSDCNPTTVMANKPRPWQSARCVQHGHARTNMAPQADNGAGSGGARLLPPIREQSDAGVWY